jgi:signal peptidase I
MRPALEPGDRLLVDPEAYRRAGPSRGDIVVLTDPERPDRLLVKRVVALPGETDTGAGAVLPGQVIVRGDFPSSRDSRAFGPVPIDRIRGRAWFRYYPSSRRGRLLP